jgi:molybdate transport system substrate-binding protein
MFGRQDTKVSNARDGCRSVVLALMIMASAAGCREHGETDSIPQAGAVMVFVAASGVDVLEDLGVRFALDGGGEVVVNAAASSTLGRQIMAGAPADLFISADRDWARSVRERIPCVGDPVDLLANELVFVVPNRGVEVPDAAVDLDAPIPPSSWGRIAIADPTHVPAGRYAKAALESIGWWGGLAGRVVSTSDVRGALRLVELGEVDAGLVYRTDAERSDSVMVAASVPSLLHERIVYPLLQFESTPEVEAFVRFLQSDEAQSVIEGHGFLTVRDSGEAR